MKPEEYENWGGDWEEIHEDYITNLPSGIAIMLTVQPMVQRGLIYKGVKIFGSGYWYFLNEKTSDLADAMKFIDIYTMSDDDINSLATPKCGSEIVCRYESSVRNVLQNLTRFDSIKIIKQVFIIAKQYDIKIEIAKGIEFVEMGRYKFTVDFDYLHRNEAYTFKTEVNLNE